MQFATRTRAPSTMRGMVWVPALLALLHVLRVAPVVAVTEPAQRAALVDLYLSTSGPTRWRGRLGWQDYANGSDPCDNAWAQVSCVNGSVT